MCVRVCVCVNLYVRKSMCVCTHVRVRVRAYQAALTAATRVVAPVVCKSVYVCVCEREYVCVRVCARMTWLS